MKVLAGDVGGTKSLLALAEVREDGVELLREARYESPAFPGLAEMVAGFLEKEEGPVGRACFGVPGPVTGEEVRTPNLPWTIRTADLARETGIAEVRLVNDYAAVGHGIEWMRPADLVTLQKGEPEERGARVVLGAGTGLGQAYLLWEGDGYVVHVSEGGHTDFAPHDELEWGLAEFLREEYGHVSWERVLSGPGLVGIHRYLTSGGLSAPCPEVQKILDDGEDPAGVISRHAMEDVDEACAGALDLFAYFYGAEAGNLALELMAMGGVYVAGGIAPKILDKLRDGTMLRAFRDKGRFEKLMERIPLHVVTNERVGLIGAAAAAASG